MLRAVADRDPLAESLAITPAERRPESPLSKLTHGFGTSLADLHGYYRVFIRSNLFEVKQGKAGRSCERLPRSLNNGVHCVTFLCYSAGIRFMGAVKCAVACVCSCMIEIVHCQGLDVEPRCLAAAGVPVEHRG